MRDRVVFDGGGGDADWNAGPSFWERPRAVVVAVLLGIAGLAGPAWGFLATLPRHREAPSQRSVEVLGGQAMLGWVAGAVAVILGVVVLRRRGPTGWLPIVAGALAVALATALEIAS
jgi:hypothetical protein